MNKNKYKIVFIDIDGTLVNDEKKVPEQNIKAIKKLKENGIEVVLTSGRPYQSIVMYSNEVGAVPYVIGSNGGIAVNFKNNINIFSQDIPKDTAIKILELIKKNNLYTAVTLSGNLVVEEGKFSLTPENRSEVNIINSLNDTLLKTQEPIMKFSIMDYDKDKLESIRRDVLNLFNVSVTKVDEFMIPMKYREEEMNYELPYVMDIMAKGTNKAVGIKELSKYLKIDLADTVVFGDGLNDIEMIKAGGLSVAMENAADELKELADVVTINNNEAGVAYELNKVFDLSE